MLVEAVIEPEQPIIRFLYETDDFRGPEGPTGAVKQRAFRTSAENDEGVPEVSVFNLAPTDRPVMWDHGTNHGPQRPILAAAYLCCGSAYAHQLTVLPTEQPPLHCVIRNWPIEEDLEATKAKHLFLRQALSKVAKLLIR